tara:strand:- start:2218 stop:2403 length:186 start_codon:yes stop_codon:yes gene_type:complete
MKHGKNSSNARPFVNPPSRKNSLSTLVIERKPTKFALYLSGGDTVWTIYAVEETGKYKKDG